MKKRLILYVLCFSIILNFASTTTLASSNKETIKVVVDGKQIEFDVEPVIENDQTLVPVRAIFEALNATVGVGDTNAYINDEKILLDVPTKIIDGRTMVPVRFISELLDCEVKWVKETKSIIINTTNNNSEENISVQYILQQAYKNQRNVKNFKRIKQGLYEISYGDSLFSTNTVLTNYVDMVDKQTYSKVANNYLIKQGETSEEINNNETIEIIINPYYLIVLEENIDNQEIQFELYDSSKFNTYLENDILFTNTTSDLLLDESTNPDYFILSINDINTPHVQKIIKQSEYDYLNEAELSVFDYRLYIDKNTYLPYQEILKIEGTFKENSFDLAYEVKFDNYNISQQTLSEVMIEQVAFYEQEEELFKIGLKHKAEGNYEEAIELFEKVLDLNANHYDAFTEIINTVYEYEGNTERFQEYLNEFEENFGSDLESLLFIGQTKFELEGIKKGLEYYKKALAIDPQHAKANNYIGVAYFYLEDYEQALDYFSKAITYDKTLAIGYTNKTNVLYQLSDYDKCIEFIDKYLNQLDESTQFDLLEYKYSCYLEKNDTENAMGVLNEMLIKYPNDEDVLLELLAAYKEEQLYEEMEVYLKTLREINSEHEAITYYTNLIEYVKKPFNERIYNFVKGNYLYLDKVEDFESKSKGFLEKNNIKSSDIENYLSEVISEEDYFSYMIFPDEYDEAISSNNNKSVEYKMLDNEVAYIKISEFNLKTYEEFKQAMKKINDKKNKKLVIDLRNNFGGNTYAATNILDYFLADCVSSTFIDRDGYTYNNNSDESAQTFKGINIFVNEHSASSSELLALGLKSYLNNVTIIGERTFGKGVGQYIFDDKENKIMIGLTSFYWNVKQNNIHYYGIIPDVEVEKDEDIYYFQALDQ